MLSILGTHFIACWACAEMFKSRISRPNRIRFSKISCYRSLGPYGFGFCQKSQKKISCLCTFKLRLQYSTRNRDNEMTPKEIVAAPYGSAENAIFRLQCLIWILTSSLWALLPILDIVISAIKPLERKLGLLPVKCSKENFTFANSFLNISNGKCKNFLNTVC